jgi:hypothetical protein
MEGNKCPNREHTRDGPLGWYSTAEDRQTDVGGLGSGPCPNTKGQAVSVRKAMVDGRFDTAASDIHVLEKPSASRTAGGTNQTGPRRYGERRFQAVP